MGAGVFDPAIAVAENSFGSLSADRSLLFTLVKKTREMPAFVSRSVLNGQLLPTLFLSFATVVSTNTAAVAMGSMGEESEARNSSVILVAQADEKAEAAPPRMLLEVAINKPSNSGRGYRRPYVAAWLTDKDGFPVRTILLWVQQDAKGRRWVPDLRKWNADDRIRGIVDDKDLVDAVSGPTRSAGNHKVGWDGLDDNGEPLPPGSYTLHVEAAREHGTYQVIHEKLELSEKSFEVDLKGNEEIKSVHVKYSGSAATEQ